MEKLSLEAVAAIWHGARRQYKLRVGLEDAGTPEWDDLDDEAKRQAMLSVRHVARNPNLTPRVAHDTWRQSMLTNGWVYGDVYDEDEKTDPNLVEYDELPEADRTEDELLVGVVGGLSDSIDEGELGASMEEEEPDPSTQEKPFVHPDGSPVKSALAEALVDIMENQPEEEDHTLVDSEEYPLNDNPELKKPKDDGEVEGHM